MRNFQMKGRRCAPRVYRSLRVTRGLQPVCRPFYLSLGYSDVALAIAGFHVDRRGRDRAQGQQIMIVALGKLHPASNCAGTFFPVARLVKIIASHSEGPPLPHLVHARPERIRLISCTILARREHMDIIELLKAERDKAAQQVNALDTAIKALSGLNSTRVSHGPRKMSAAARARISASQKARWARARGQKVVSIAPKRRPISAAGLARIRAAQRARWARVRRSK